MLLVTLRKTLKICFYSLLVILGVVFCVSNRAKVELTLFPLPYAISIPVFIFVIFTLLAGMLAGWAIARIKTHHIAKDRKIHMARSHALENELAALHSERLIKQK